MLVANHELQCNDPTKFIIITERLTIVDKDGNIIDDEQYDGNTTQAICGCCQAKAWNERD